MDLEDTLDIPIESGVPESEFNPLTETAEDVLGLDKEIKLTKRAKIAKIDNQRIFNSQTGLAYITKNHGGVIRTIRKNDKNFEKNSTGRVSKSAKYDHEYNNLTTVLQFYQLWCHGLFPKAKFKDCLHLIRTLGSKSPQLKMYRRELIEQELKKLRIEKGIIDEGAFEVDVEGQERESEPSGETNPTNQANTGTTSTTNAVPEDDEDDWSFMNVRPRAPRGNGLFLDDDDDDDLYSTPTVPITTQKSDSVPITQAVMTGTASAPTPVSSSTQIAETPTTTTETTNSLQNAPPTQSSTVPTENESDDPFSDDEDIILASKNTPTNQEYYETTPDDQQLEQDELELMREFE